MQKSFCRFGNRFSNKIVALIVVLSAIFSFYMPKSSVQAADPVGFFLTPSQGYVKVGSQFVIDIMINSPVERIMTARAVLGFDPDVVRVVKAERNSSIFCLWPDDQQSVDNTNGLVMVTGFCQSGAGTPYKTTGTSDVFARITFSVLKVGDLNMKWEYNGQDLPFKSVLMKDGSPPLNILSSAPTDAKFTAVQKTVAPVRPVNNNNNVPATGVIDSSSALVGGVILAGSMLIFVGGGIWARSSRRASERKYGTVVVYR